jgi:uncharacterized protein (TIGR03083 family)
MTADPRTWTAALRNSHERLASVAGPLTAEQLRAQSYCTDWTIAQVLSHLGSGAEIGTLMLASALAGTPLDREAFPAIWDTWNNRSPEAQAADCLTWDQEHVARLEALTDAELGSIGFDFFGTELDAVGLIGLRLGEHAVHTWDVAVTLDPAAVVAPDAVTLLIAQLPRLLRFAGKPSGDSFRVRVHTKDPDGDYLLDVADTVAMSDWAPGMGADGGIQIPAEALLRLVYGRLDVEHAPAGVSADGIDLDRLRAVFPGF